MAKRQSKGLKEALAVVNQLGQQMNAEAQADYEVALSAAAAGGANLAQQTRGLTRDLVRGQRTQTAGLSRLVRQSKAERQRVLQQQQNTVRRYGTALGGSIAQSFGQARAVAAGGVKTSQAAKAAGKTMARTAGTVADIAAQGVQAQQAAAEYSLNQALAARNAISAETLAGLTGQMYQTALQYNLQWEMWKKQQTFAEKQAQKANVAGAEQLIQDGAGVAEGAAQAFRDWFDENGDNPDENPLNITEIAAQYAAENGYAYGPDGASPEMTLFIKTLQNIKNGMNTAPAYESAIRSLYAGQKNWDEWGEPVLSAAVAKLELDASASYLQWTQGANRAQGEGGPGVFSGSNPSYGNPLLGEMAQRNVNIGNQPWWMDVINAPREVLEDIANLG